MELNEPHNTRSPKEQEENSAFSMILPSTIGNSDNGEDPYHRGGSRYRMDHSLLTTVMSLPSLNVGLLPILRTILCTTPGSTEGTIAQPKYTPLWIPSSSAASGSGGRLAAHRTGKSSVQGGRINYLPAKKAGLSAGKETGEPLTSWNPHLFAASLESGYHGTT